MRWRAGFTGLLSMAAVAASPLSAAAEERDLEAAFATITRNIVEAHIRPGFEGFAASAELLELALADHCARPSAAGFAVARTAFREALLAYSRIEHLGLGPMRNGNRAERVLFWPDPRGRALKQVQRALASQDATVTDAARLAEKSVALQGFPALEYLLHGAPAETVGTEAGSHACRFAAAIAGNLATIGRAALAEWNDAEGFPAELLAPGPDRAVARSHREAAETLLSTIPTSLEAVRDFKILRVIGDSAEAARPKRAPFWRSELTTHVIAANLSGLQHMVEVSDLRSILPDEAEYLVGNSLFGFRVAEMRLADMRGPIADLLGNPDHRATFKYLTVAIRQMQMELGQDLFRALDLNMGFNALDGD